MAETGEILGLLEQINNAAAEPPLSLAEKVMGYSRSYLAGPSFNFADNIEAAIAAPFTDKTYSEELSGIRSEQDRFKRNTDYLDNIVEIGSGAILNPIAEIGALAKGANYGAKTAATLLTNPVAQAVYSGIGADNGEDPLKAAGMSALIGAGGSVVANKLGGVLTNAERNADRLKTSAYGVTAADITRQLKKMGDGIDQLSDAGSIPVVRSLEKYEKAGVIDASNDIIDNIKNLYGIQGSLGTKITGLLDEADKAITPKADFGLDNTISYISSLSGTAKEKAAAAADAELSALIPDLGAGRLKDLQKLKVGLNYKFDQNPYADDVIKALRSDLRAEIEKRVDDAATAGLLPSNSPLPGTLKYLNKEWGEAAELKDIFRRKAGNDFKGDPVSDLIMGGATTGGTGTLNIAGAATGNPAYWGASALLGAAQVPAAKSKLADVLREADQLKLNKLGEVIQEAGTARNVEQAYESTKEPKPYTGGEDSIESLLGKINAVGDNEAPKSTLGKQLSAIVGTPKQKESSLSSMLSSVVGIPEASAMENFSIQGDDVDLTKVDKVAKKLDVKLTPLDKAQIMAESAANPNAIGPKTKYGKAKGLMQLLDSTGKEWARKLDIEDYDPFDAEQNIKIGKAYRDYLIKRYDGDTRLGLAAYNYGMGNIDKLLSKYGDSYDKIERHLPEETYDYVNKIMGVVEA